LDKTVDQQQTTKLEKLQPCKKVSSKHAFSFKQEKHQNQKKLDLKLLSVLP